MHTLLTRRPELVSGSTCPPGSRAGGDAHSWMLKQVQHDGVADGPLKATKATVRGVVRRSFCSFSARCGRPKRGRRGWGYPLYLLKNPPVFPYPDRAARPYSAASAIPPSASSASISATRAIQACMVARPGPASRASRVRYSARSISSWIAWVPLIGWPWRSRV
jgi:hypothetical protein